ncbi:hypothetical protein [Pseudomonas sp. 3A(2025)]
MQSSSLLSNIKPMLPNLPPCELMQRREQDMCLLVYKSALFPRQKTIYLIYSWLTPNVVPHMPYRGDGSTGTALGAAYAAPFFMFQEPGSVGAALAAKCTNCAVCFPAEAGPTVVLPAKNPDQSVTSCFKSNFLLHQGFTDVKNVVKLPAIPAQHCNRACGNVLTSAMHSQQYRGVAKR